MQGDGLVPLADPSSLSLRVALPGTESKLMSFRNTSRSFKEMVSFRFRQIAPHLERMLGVPLTTESKRKHAKATSRQTDIFVGPRPVHGHRLVSYAFPPCLHLHTCRFERADLVGSHGRWKRPRLQTAHMTI